MLIQTLYRLDDGTIEKRSNKGIWEKISISQYDFNKATKGFITQDNLSTAIGDIETALDNIIAIQNSLLTQAIGGDVE